MTGPGVVAPRPAAGQPARRRTVVIAALVGLGLALLGVGWALSLPFNGTADEQAHFIKALGVADLDPAGSAVPPSPQSATSRSATPQARFIRSASRRFRVPAHLNPHANTGCFVLKPRRPASCLGPVTSTGSPTAVTYVGVYPPVAYAAPGVAARLAQNPASSLMAARIVNGVTCVLLWSVGAAAFVACSRRRGWLVAGLLLSITPAAVALAWSLNPNGPEAAAAVAFLALTLAATRPAAPRWMWWLMAPVGFLLATSRPLSPLWVVFALAVPILLRGRPALSAVRRGGKAAVCGIGVSIVGTMATGVWNGAIGAQAPGGRRNWARVIGDLPQSFPRLQFGAISQVDWGEIGLSSHAYRPWLVLTTALLVTGLLAGTWRQRLGLVSISAAYLAICLGMLGLSSTSGFPTGGRYLLAAAVALPLAAADVCQDRIAKLSPVALVSAVVVAVGGQTAVLYESARRYSVGTDGPRNFLWSGGPRWEAAGGWPLVVGLSVSGAVLLAALVLTDVGHRPAAGAESEPGQAEDSGRAYRGETSPHRDRRAPDTRTRSTQVEA